MAPSKTAEWFAEKDPFVAEMSVPKKAHNRSSTNRPTLRLNFVLNEFCILRRSIYFTVVAYCMKERQQNESYMQENEGCVAGEPQTDADQHHLQAMLSVSADEPRRPSNHVLETKQNVCTLEEEGWRKPPLRKNDHVRTILTTTACSASYTQKMHSHRLKCQSVFLFS